MIVKLKMTYHDNLFAFLCWQFLKIGFKQFYAEVVFFSFHYTFNFLTRMSNATNGNKYAWQFHFVFCYVFLYTSCDNNNCNNNIFLSHWYIMSITTCFKNISNNKYLFFEKRWDCAQGGGYMKKNGLWLRVYWKYCLATWYFHTQ